MFAVVETGGKQYRMAVGDTMLVERLEGDRGTTVELGRVLMIAGGDETMLGSPVVDGVTVLGRIVEVDALGPKIRVFKYKAKKHYRRTNGHRQLYTRLHVTDIVRNGESMATPPATAEPEADDATEE